MSYLKVVSGARRMAALTAMSAVALGGIQAATASADTLGSKNLSRGQTGAYVGNLQGYLTLAGDTIKVSGNFGLGTQNDVKTFQKSAGLQADGVVGPATKTALENDVIKKYGANAISSGTATAASASTAPFKKAKLVDGLAIPAPGTPTAIQEVIWAANDIAFKPYVYGGGHSAYTSTNGGTQLASGYDCSGLVSFALHGAGLLSAPDDSGSFYSFGKPGTSNWLTVYTSNGSKGDHAYLVVAGLRFDTVASQGDVSKQWPNGDAWSTNVAAGAEDLWGQKFTARHPVGL